VAAFSMTMRRASCFISRSRMLACASDALHRMDLAMRQFAIQLGERFPEPRDDQRHPGNVDHRLVRTLAVKPLVFDAPLRGLGA
jgi:hypothetical protein